MGAKRSLLFLLSAFVVGSASAVTNGIPRAPGYRGVLKIGHPIIEVSCSANFVAKSATHFYLLTAAHCIYNFRDGGVTLFDPFNSQKMAYKSSKVFLPKEYYQNPELSKSLDKVTALEIGKKKIEALKNEVARKAADLEMRIKILGSVPKDTNDVDEEAEDHNYFFYESRGKDPYTKFFLHQAPDVALVEFDYKEWVNEPSPELQTLVKKLPAQEIASTPTPDGQITYIGYAGNESPTEGNNTVFIKDDEKELNNSAGAYEIFSPLGLAPYHYVEGENVDADDPRTYFKKGLWAAVQHGDSGGAAIQHDRLRGVICKTMDDLLTKEQLKGQAWPRKYFSDNNDYEIIRSSSTDLASPRVHEFLADLVAQGIPLLLQDENLYPED